jgi:hypothetical protein
MACLAIRAAVKPLLAALAIWPLLVSASTADPHPVAVLRALDKVTTRVSTLVAPLNEAAAFGNLEIVPRHCDKRPPEEPPETAVFLEIWELRSDQPPMHIFTGWMFASSPGLSAIEHPIYDIWVLDCANSAAKASSTESGRP